jgi:hypothetical protein
MQPSSPMEMIPLDDNEGSHFNAAIVLVNSTIKANSHIPCHAHAVLQPCRSESDFSRPGHSTAGVRHGMCELTRHGMGTAGARHGTVCVNLP